MSDGGWEKEGERYREKERLWEREKTEKDREKEMRDIIIIHSIVTQGNLFFFPLFFYIFLISRFSFLSTSRLQSYNISLIHSVELCRAYTAFLSFFLFSARKRTDLIGRILPLVSFLVHPKSRERNARATSLSSLPAHVSLHLFSATPPSLRRRSYKTEIKVTLVPSFLSKVYFPFRSWPSNKIQWRCYGEDACVACMVDYVVILCTENVHGFFACRVQSPGPLPCSDDERWERVISILFIIYSSLWESHDWMMRSR